MTKKLTKTDLFFIASLTIGIFALSIYLFIHPYLYDEAFYATIPYRLINGDSLIQHEWHLSQFSSLFSYLPVRIWLALKGSAEGIIVFLRCVYFSIHTAATVLIYLFFRKYEKWSIVAAMMFFTQIPYRIFAISYNSMFVLFTLLFTLCLISVYSKASRNLYILAGICFGCCCVCNPLYCLAVLFYIVSYALWLKREPLKKLLLKIHLRYISKTEKAAIHKKQSKKREKKKSEIDIFTNMESYNCFFCKEAFIFFSVGVLIICAIAIFFFFATGGSVNSIFENLHNILNSSEYNILSVSLFEKLKKGLYYFNQINFKAPFILPLLYLSILLDGKRRTYSHRFIYLIISLSVSIMYTFAIVQSSSESINFNTCFFSLPFNVFSSVCYILTHKKNTVLFRCLWLPSMLAAFFQFFAANSFLTSLGMTLAINNIAGVFFARALFYEVKSETRQKSKSTQNKEHKFLVRYVLYSGLALQFVFHILVLQYGQLAYSDDITKASSGPYSGMIMTKEQHQIYTNNISDFDFIRSINTENSPILIDSYRNWLYMYSETPIANYTTWYSGIPYTKELSSYYKENPEKIPKYIYIDCLDYYSNRDTDLLNRKLELAGEMFDFTQEELSSGILLTVEKYKF